VSLVVATGDWHGDHRTHGVSRFDEVARHARRSVEVAIERGAALWVFGGDLCDPDSGPVVLRCVELLIECALRAVRAGIPALVLSGNHCVYEDSGGGSVVSPLRAVAAHERLLTVAEQPAAYDVPWYRAGGEPFAVVALPFAPRARAYDPEAFVRSLTRLADRRVLLVSHLSVPGIQPGEETAEMPRGREVLLPLAAVAQTLPRAVVVQHHYHRRQTYRPKGGPTVHVVGSLARLTHGEEDHDPAIVLFEV
jgi:DNA repair exonuclease SbcCD nuclease subunit